MAIVELSPESLKQHIGRRAVSTDVVTSGPANLLRLAFGRPEPELRQGDPLPPLRERDGCDRHCHVPGQPLAFAGVQSQQFGRPDAYRKGRGRRHDSDL